MKSADALMYMITGALIGIAALSLWNDREKTNRLHREYVSERMRELQQAVYLLSHPEKARPLRTEDA